MDIKIDDKEGKFKFRVCGIIQVDEKYLVVDICKNGFYCCPGGHVELGESTLQAVQREMKEETDCEIEIIKELAIIQNLFKHAGKVFHEIGYYYLVKPTTKINTQDYVKLENDKGEIKELKFKWFTLDELKKQDFRPRVLLDCLDSNEFRSVINFD